jgi:hypothetical protein
MILAWSSAPVDAAAPQKVFPTPEAAAQAVVEAARNSDEGVLLEIFGPEFTRLVSADKRQAREGYARFVGAAQEALTLYPESDTHVTLILGDEAWPFPIPLVREAGGWRFDTATGAEEILNRRIGRNELAAIEVLRAYVQAQREYAAMPRDGTRVRKFAQRIRSTPGKQDGLYWDAPAGSGEEVSPFGPLLPDAASRQPGDPYDGYYFRILTRQGPAAPGGAYSYIINGNMVAGFAMIAYPAKYGNTGIMTFMVSHYGTVYQKDLGPKTAQRAAAIREYNPDSTWREAQR